MYQNITNQLRRTTSTATNVAIDTWSVERHASGLMNDLFSEIDQIIAHGSKLETEPVQPQEISNSSKLIPSKNMPREPIPYGQLLQETVQFVHKKDDQGERNNLDKILFIISCTSLVSVIFWLFKGDLLDNSFFFQLLDRPVSLDNSPSDDARFIEYMSRSLEMFDRKAEASKKQTIREQTSSPVNLAPHNSLSSSPQTEQVIERIYIPIYQPTLISNPTPTISTAPITDPLPPPPSPNPEVAAQKVPVPPPPSPQPEVAAQKVPVPPPPSSPQAVASSSTFDHLVSSRAPNSNVRYTLLGLLELGEQSAALFDINGITQTIHIREQIGATGWTLESLTNQKAVIRRNEEVRSIYVGEKF